MPENERSILVDTARSYLTGRSYGQLKKAATAAGLSEQWLYKFHQGKIENPSVIKIEKLLLSAGFDITVEKTNK